MSSEWIYGCYQANGDRLYRWQCKRFDNEEEASDYLLKEKKDALGPSFIITGSTWFPEALHQRFIQNTIKENLSQVEIRK